MQSPVQKLTLTLNDNLTVLYEEPGESVLVNWVPAIIDISDWTISLRISDKIKFARKITKLQCFGERRSRIHLNIYKLNVNLLCSLNVHDKKVSYTNTKISEFFLP